MEQQALIWLSTSLFVSKANWHHILQEGIRPFVENTAGINAYTIEFNYLSGENIRLALLTDKKDKEDISRKTDAYFRHYFAKANLPQLPVKLPVAGVFMPFPANTIQYGLYPSVTIEKKELDQYKLSITLSKIIIDASKDEIDEETILTLAFYLQISLVKTIYKLLNNAYQLLAVIPAADNFKADTIALANLSLMKEITDDVMQVEVFDSDLNWLNGWIGDCNTALLTAGKTEANNISQIKSIYQVRIQTIYNHLGINMYGQHMLNYFVIKSLEQHFLVSK